MKEILVKVPEWVDEELIRLQMQRIVSLEGKRRELIGETLEKISIGAEELVELERVREEVWREEKKKLGLKSS